MRTMRAMHAGAAAFIAGVLALALIAGGGAAWAHWTATAQGSGQVSTPSVRISQTDFPALGATYINTHARLSNTGSFTITNNGSVAGVASSRITAPGTIAPQMPLRIWPVSSPGACTASTAVPAAATTGTWAAAAVEGTTLAAGGSQTFCVRTEIPIFQRSALASSTGTTTVAGTLNVSLTATGTGWTATAPAVQAAQATQAIYPLDSGANVLARPADSRWYSFRNAGTGSTCLDVSGNGGAGSLAIAWQCLQSGTTHPQANQFWQVIPVTPSDPSIVTLRPRHAPTTRLAVDTSGRQVTAAANPSLATQQWIVQRMSTADVATAQFVSAVDGRCLALPSTASGNAVTTRDCTDPSTVLVTPVRSRLGFRPAGMLTNHVLIVGPRAMGAPLTLQRRSSAGVWNSVATGIPLNQPNELQFSAAALSTGTNTMRLTFADGTVAYEFVLAVSNSGTVTPTSGFG
ncbi:hypothetical protein [Citricoccus sp.]|uniref:RICIN domain-containing protein n=1 Tax=Citricoccus sp. TaxID=1978372 RepID=UPI0028BD4706|nr:hypothetical protein [Citricoccus sp.]